MPIRSASEIIVNEIIDAVAAFKSCVTPIFDVNDNCEAQLLGTAVLIGVGKEIYLCTAHHVIRKNSDSSLYIDGPNQFEILVGEFQSSEEHDVAVLKLTSVQAEALKKYKPLGADAIANQSQASTSKYVIFLGYPETKNRRIYHRSEMPRQIQLNGCKPLQITSEKVRISFNRNRT